MKNIHKIEIKILGKIIDFFTKLTTNIVVKM
jgi:hypothetical protein